MEFSSIAELTLKSKQIFVRHGIITIACIGFHKYVFIPFRTIGMRIMRYTPQSQGKHASWRGKAFNTEIIHTFSLSVSLIEDMKKDL